VKLHPLSAVTRGLRRGLVTASFVFFLLAMARFVLSDTGTVVSAIFALFPIAFVAGFAYQVQYYRRFEYELTEDTLDVSSGVFGRKEREIPYRRIQNVDVIESIFHRVFGVAVVSIETAGGSETEAQFDFVTASEARRLQREIRERRREIVAEATDEQEPESTGTATETAVASSAAEGMGDAGTGVETGVSDQPSTTEGRIDDQSRPTQLFELDVVELLILSVASFQAASILVFLFGFPLVQDFVVTLLSSLTGVPLDLRTLTETPDLALFVAVVALVVGILGTWALSAVLTFFEYYGFTLGRRGDDLVYERGLLQRYSGSIPTDKIQTLTITENVIMRQFGYAGLTVETAGYSPGQSQSGGGAQSAIPLADRERTLELARSLESFGNVEFTRPPKRARRRYAARYTIVLAVVTAALRGIAQIVAGFTLWYPPALLLPVVPVAAHLKWRHRGYYAGKSQFVVRSGFWRQTTRIVPYYRLQTVFRSRTIFQRRLDLAHLTADTATASMLGSRDATAFDIEAEDARRLAETHRKRLQTSIRERATA